MNFNDAVETIMKMIESDSFGEQLAIECIRRAPDVSRFLWKSGRAGYEDLE